MDSHQTKATHFQFVSIHGESFDYPTIPVVRTRRWRKFQKQKLTGEVVVANHGWQSESTDGPKGGWSCVFWSGCNVCSGHTTTTVGCSVV